MDYKQTEPLVSNLKTLMGYTDQLMDCQNCKHHYEDYDTPIECRLNPAINFKVSRLAHCNYWNKNNDTTNNSNS